MNVFRSLFRPFRSGSTSFNRYYAGVIGEGSGYPTADEARADMRSQQRSLQDTWFR